MFDNINVYIHNDRLFKKFNDMLKNVKNEESKIFISEAENVSIDVVNQMIDHAKNGTLNIYFQNISEQFI